ncbi:hypothetical protein QWZ06_03000 [Chryseobacterium tructae]|uniref:Uncharacterized protein n=1 Tax=Chryseobacterium tructae TaxID=1037380 RepID=A0ABV7XV46_9FLAO|nr:hypothetical protein [Chryseobacterium tructae]MDN3691299.1 hypothetical protein [Chryseobacterium tructae]
MDSEKIKLLRNKITIPLSVAIQLLKKNNGDINASEQEFHNNNISEISVSTACDLDTAKENYELCQYDITKAIEKINSKPIIITTRDNPSPRNEIGFILWPENKDGEHYKTVKRNDAFIPTADFDYVINEFKAVFPLINPWNGYMEDGFDTCGHNYFDRNTCRIIIDRISQMKTDELKTAQFKAELIEWLNDKLIYSEYIVIYGNL